MSKSKSKFKTKITRIYNLIIKTLKYVKIDNIDEYSAQCSYYTILSFIPFVILLLTLIQYTGLKEDVLFKFISSIIPSSMNEIVIKIVKEVYSKSLGTISISIIFTIWSAGKGLYVLSKGLHKMYNNNAQNEESTNYLVLRIRSVLYTVAFIIFLVIALVGLVFSSSLLSIVQERLGILQNGTILIEVMIKLALLVATIFAFNCIYKFMPKHKVTFFSQVYGAIFGAISLNIISLVFSKYLDIFKNFSITYGSLTTLMLVMMWTYSCFYTVFLGAKLNKLVNQKRNRKGSKKQKDVIELNGKVE